MEFASFTKKPTMCRARNADGRRASTANKRNGKRFKHRPRKIFTVPNLELRRDVTNWSLRLAIGVIPAAGQRGRKNRITVELDRRPTIQSNRYAAGNSIYRFRLGEGHNFARCQLRDRVFLHPCDAMSSSKKARLRRGTKEGGRHVTD